jgi:hypothetical protein
MCDPVTATALMVASTAVAATGKVVEGVGQAQQFRYQATVDRENAKLANSQARDSIENTNLDARRRYRQLGQTKGAQTAAMAANGVDLTFGTPTDIARDTAMIGAEDISQIYKGGYERTRGFEINAFNFNSSAAGNRSKARGAEIGAAFGAASTALGGASQISRMNRP